MSVEADDPRCSNGDYVHVKQPHLHMHGGRCKQGYRADPNHFWFLCYQGGERGCVGVKEAAET